MAGCSSPDRPMSHSVVIVPGGTGGTGGLSIDVRNLTSGLAARGHEVVVASADATDPALLELEQATVLPLRRRGPASLAARSVCTPESAVYSASGPAPLSTSSHRCPAT